MVTKRLNPKKNKLTEADVRRSNYIRLRKILPQSVSIPLDGILCAASNSFHIDVFRLEKQIPNYNGDECTYKGKSKYSMSMAIEEEWGTEAKNLISSLL